MSIAPASRETFKNADSTSGENQPPLAFLPFALQPQPLALTRQLLLDPGRPIRHQFQAEVAQRPLLLQPGLGRAHQPAPPPVLAQPQRLLP